MPADVDGPSLTAINLAISAGNGTLVDNGNGTWTYHPAANDDTSVTLQLRGDATALRRRSPPPPASTSPR